MSRYETIDTELREIRVRQALAIMVPATAIAGLAIYTIDSPPGRIWAALAALGVVPFVLHYVWQAVFPAYRSWSGRASQIIAEIAGLRRHVAAVFEQYRERRKGEQFKKAYNLSGRSVADLEEALAVGMYREQREVFVTAFVRSGVAVRVTAAIGYPFRCSAADNPARWTEHVERLGCDEIRQYHNHPVHDGNTGPSSSDVKTTASLKSLLSPQGSQLRSLIICWNRLGEWKVFEHDETGRTWLNFEYDAAK